MNNQSSINQYFSRFIAEYLPENADNRGSSVNEIRKAAANLFYEKGISSKNNEMWRHFPWEKITQNAYTIQQESDPYTPVDSFFNCSAHNIDSYQFAFLNGFYIHKNAPLTVFPNGLIIGSLREAAVHYSELIAEAMQKMSNSQYSAMHNLNLSLWKDGLFVYVPADLHVGKAIQLVNLVKTNQDLFINPKNLIIVGKNASLKLIHCDDTLESNHSLINGTMDILVDEHANLDYFKLENKENKSVLINNLRIYQYACSKVSTHTNTFNGGLVHNTIEAHLLGTHADISLNGLFLADKQQYVSNCLSIKHYAANCTSRQLYNGILDDAAKARFMGHIFVAPDAQKTEAYQLNHNILLTDEAEISTKPFLEIYADDVKCSHGATVGQLDNDAVFYLRSRGICEKNARMLLMHAFAKEVADKINIEPLQSYIEDLVEKRLTGQPIACTQCPLCCENKPIEFKVNIPEV
ncbi:MAG: Fe-S cluster assembly protein SufD [Lentimicrobiaceae bacterium]|nr:Fe-S cluster assembly protein SufD [Lentimicrobiaceae bacterium]